MLLHHRERVFDLLAFDRQFRSHYPHYVSYDLEAPACGETLAVRATDDAGERAILLFNHLKLLDWKVYR